MPGVVLSLMLTLVVAGFAWLLLGSRIAMSRDEEQNSILNFFIYFLGILPFSIAVVFFGLQ